jgi:hypothetical protein
VWGQRVLVHIDRSLFQDYFAREAFAEDKVIKRPLEGYVESFEMLLSSFSTHKNYGSHKNRKFLKKANFMESGPWIGN